MASKAGVNIGDISWRRHQHGSETAYGGMA